MSYGQYVTTAGRGDINRLAPVIENYLNPGKRIFQSKRGLCEAKIGAKSERVETFWCQTLSRKSDLLWVKKLRLFWGDMSLCHSFCL